MSTLQQQLKDQIEETLEKQDREISVEGWRDNQLTLLVLPSGQRIKAKQITLFELVVGGKIPDTLTPIALAAINSQKNKPDFNRDQLIEYEKMINVCVLAVVVEPPVAEVPDNTHIGIREISWIDRTYIFEWANGAAKTLASFR